MEMIRVGLTSMRLVECELYLYPAELYDIDGLERYDDLETLYRYAYERLKKYYKKEVGLYINGGLLIEVLTAMLAAENLDIVLHIFHWNRETGVYMEQKIRARMDMEQEREKETVERSLCSKRHFAIKAIPIFEEIPKERVMDFEWMQCQADSQLEQLAGERIKLYASGLTQALISVWNAAKKYSVELEVLHYNIDTEDYFIQKLM